MIVEWSYGQRTLKTIISRREAETMINCAATGHGYDDASRAFRLLVLADLCQALGHEPDYWKRYETAPDMPSDDVAVRLHVMVSRTSTGKGIRLHMPAREAQYLVYLLSTGDAYGAAAASVRLRCLARLSEAIWGDVEHWRKMG